MEKQYVIKANTTTTIVPTMFVEADPNTFKDLVQKLTGSSGDSPDKLPLTPSPRQPKSTNPPVNPTGPRRSSHFKLQDRRQTTMRKLELKLSLATIGGGAPSTKRRRWLDSSAPSPITPLCSESLFFPSSGSPSPAESPAGERGYCLLPSPLTTPRGSDPPELLNLFPLSSPRVNVADKPNRE